MGKKPFINKKKAATFTLVYRDSLNEGDGADAGGDKVFTRIDGGTSHVPGFSQYDPWSRLPVEERGRPSVPPGRRAPQHREGEGDGDWEEWDGEDEEGWELESGEWLGGRGHLSLQKFEETMFGIGGPPFSSDRTQNRVTEDTRKEILEMGFPDDGYNYMQHLRQIGGRVGSAFIPAPKPKLSLRPDVQAFDARKARLAAASREQIEGEDATADMPPKEVFRGVRPIQQRGQRPLGLDPDIAKALEESDGSECEDGDMLEDDFVILANEEAGPSGEGGSASRQDGTWLGNQEDGVTELEVKRRRGTLDAGGDDDVWGSDEEGGQRAGGRHKKGPDVSGDASGLETRSFRKGTSSVGTRELERSARLIDEQFENVRT